MPVTLVPLVVPRSPLALFQTQTVRQRLTRLAARVAGRLLTLWRALFAEVRRGLDLARLAHALTAPHLLEAEQVVMAQWQTDVERPARTLLPVLWQDVLQQVARLVEPEMRDVAGLPVQVLPLPETQQALEQQTGSQITAVTTTTLLGVRQLLRRERDAGGGLARQAQHVQAGLGLTPVQVRQLDQARARWQQEGRSAQQIQAGVEEATARGLSQRLRAIAQTQAYGAVNLGHRLAMTQAAQTGLGVGTLRRYWHVQPGACPVCRQVPGMNPQGVELTAPFSTPNGPMMQPPAHVSCRCSADYRGGDAR